jgi:uncharacterized protein DUF6221
MVVGVTDDLVRQILAAIEATETLAGQVAEDVGAEWSAGGDLGNSVSLKDGSGYVATGPYDYMSWELRQHIARHDPASVLCCCAAARETIELCVEVIGERDLSNYGQFGLLKDDPNSLAVTLAVETLRNLATGYGITQEAQQ